MSRLEKCGCDESEHLRRALRAIVRIASEHTGLTLVEDIAQMNNLAYHALKLQRLKGDPGISSVEEWMDKP